MGPCGAGGPARDPGRDRALVHLAGQAGTAGRQKQELSDLGTQNRKLKQRLRALRDPGALEREARRLGMVRVGERAYVIENLP